MGKPGFDSIEPHLGFLFQPSTEALQTEPKKALPFRNLLFKQLAQAAKYRSTQFDEEECQEVNLSPALDHSDSWALCPDGYFFHGLNLVQLMDMDFLEHPVELYVVEKRYKGFLSVLELPWFAIF